MRSWPISLRVAGCLAVLTVSAQAAPTLAAPGQVVTRYVLGYSDPASIWEVDRGAQQLKLAPGLPLETGDCVILHDVQTYHRLA